jgi:hypothetical protein
MGYPKTDIASVTAANPDMKISDMAAEAVRSHERVSGCTFEPFASSRAIVYLNLDPEARADSLSGDMQHRLGRALEALEIKCPDRSKSK